MNRTSKALGVLVALTTTASVAAADGSGDDSGQYRNYYAARRALDRGDCGAAVGYLDAYLRNHSYIRDRYPDHYLEIRFARERCVAKVKIRGIGSESGEDAPLPDHPPMED